MEKVDVECIDSNRDGGDRDHFKDSRNKGNHDTGIAIADNDLESWNGDPRYMKEEGVFFRNNSDLERWVPTSGSDEDSLYRAKSNKEGSRLADKTKYLESDKPSRKRQREEAKNDKKKRNSAWLIEEETEKQQHSPVTLSDIEFSTEFDGRIVNREFQVAQDYRRGS